MTKKQACVILNISENASLEEIKEAFSEKIVQYKPDESPDMFMKVHEAYEFLTSGTKSPTEDPFYTENFHFTPDQWDDDFEQMDQEYDDWLEKEKIRQAELERKQEEKKKKAEEKAKKKFNRKYGKYLKPEDPLSYKWDQIFGGALYLFVLFVYMSDMEFMPSLVLCGIFLFYKLTVIYLQKNKNHKKWRARWEISLICTIVVFILGEFYPFASEAGFDIAVYNFIIYLLLSFVSGMVALFSFMKKKIIS